MRHGPIFALVILGFFALAPLQTFAAAATPSADPVTSCKPAGKPPKGKDGLPCKDEKNPVLGVCTSGECKATSYTDQSGKSHGVGDLSALVQLLKAALDQLSKSEPPSPTPGGGTGGCPPIAQLGTSQGTSQMLAPPCYSPCSSYPPYPYMSQSGNSSAVQMLPCYPRPYPICLISQQSLAQGAMGEDVKTLQTFLAGQNMFSGDATGFFGPLTRAALAQFQLKNGIVNDASAGGMLGPLTWNYIYSNWCTNPPPTTGGDPSSDPNCKQWRTCGGPTCSRSAPGATPQCGTDYTMEMCLAAPTVCGQYFSTPTTGSSCVVHRHCGDLIVPNGGVAGNSKACGVACPAPAMCVNGGFVQVGTYSTPHQFETSCPDDPYSL